jgi:hypothetical protein
VRQIGRTETPLNPSGAHHVQSLEQWLAQELMRVEIGVIVLGEAHGDDSWRTGPRWFYAGAIGVVCEG